MEDEDEFVDARDGTEERQGMQDGDSDGVDDGNDDFGDFGEFTTEVDDEDDVDADVDVDAEEQSQAPPGPEEPRIAVESVRETIPSIDLPPVSSLTEWVNGQGS